MLFRKSEIAMFAAVIATGLPGSSLMAQTTTAQAIKDSVIIDIPLILGDVEQVEAASTLWVKGEKPVSPLLARFSVRPIEVAAVGAEGSELSKSLLWRAIPDGSARVLTLHDVQGTEGPRYFCGVLGGGRGLACFIDKDGDRNFDHVAEAISERGSQPYHITIMKGEKPIGAPLAYRILKPEQRPAISIELRNCDKDYDRPRYVAISPADRAIPVDRGAFVWQAKDSSFASCRRANRIDAYPDAEVVTPAGGYLAQIGPMAFSVGPKQDARLKLLGPVDSLSFQRLEGNSLVPVSIGYTPNQAQLNAFKKFPYPVLMSNAGAVVQGGFLAVGERLASIPFHHAYRGKLTQDISVSTLFGKRALAAGTIVYGFPARSKLTRTVNGIPDFQSVGDDEYRKINLNLTWCAPMRAAVPAKQRPGALGRNGWSAACIPYSLLGNYTILTDREPAFDMSGVSYDANTSSNDGQPPVQRDDEAGFQQPLRMDYHYEGRDGEFISLSERVYFGDELTSSAIKKLYAPAGKVSAKMAGVTAELAAADNGTLAVTASGSPQAGVNPHLSWDQRAHMMRQLQNMGLKMVPSTEAAETEE